MNASFIEISVYCLKFRKLCLRMTLFPPKKSAHLYSCLASKGPRLFGDEGGELDMGKLALFRRGAEVATNGMEIEGDKKGDGSKKGVFCFCFCCFMDG